MASKELILSPRRRQKAIWGSGGGGFNDFMQIDSSAGSGLTEYTANRDSFNRAYFSDINVKVAVTRRGDAIAQVPLAVYQKGLGRKWNEIDHEALGIIERTNPMNWQVGKQWHRWNLGSLDLHGHSCSQFAFDGRGKPSELYWLPPSVYTPVPDPATGFFMGIRVMQPGGKTYNVPSSQLYYTASGSPTDPISGTSRITAIRMELNLRSYAQQSNYWFFKNNQRPDWIMTGDFAPTDENVARLRRLINQWAGGDNRRGPLILGGGNMNAHLLTTNAKDAEWIGQQRLSEEKIAAAFGVPVFFLNNLERSSYASYDTAIKAWWFDTLIPEFNDYASQLTLNFLNRFWPESVGQKLRFGFDFTQVSGLQEDLAKIWEREHASFKIFTEHAKEGIVTPNQARSLMVDGLKRLGVDPTPYVGSVPWGDSAFVPWTMIKRSEAGLTPVFDAMALRGPNGSMVQNPPGLPPGVDFEQAADQMLADQMLAAQSLAASRVPAPAAGKAKELEAGDDPPNMRSTATEPPVGVEGHSEKAISLPSPLPVRDARLQPVQLRVLKRLKKHFQGLQREALRTLRSQKSDYGQEAISKADPPDPLDPQNQPPVGPYWNQKDSQDALEQLGNDLILDSGMAAYTAATQDFQLAVSWDLTNPWLPAYMGTRINLIKGIDQNLHDDLQSTLTEGATSGESIPKLSQRVTDLFADAIGYRAERIARTETIQAYGSASLQAYKEAGILQAKMYDGPNADPDCIDVNGQIVSLIDAEALMAAEHINGTRGVAPVVDMPVIPIPKAIEPPKNPFIQIGEMFVEVLKANNETMIAAFREMKQDTHIELPDAPAIYLNPSFHIDSGAITSNTPIQSGAIQHTTVVEAAKAPEPAPVSPPVELEYDPDEVQIEEKDGKYRATRKD